MYKVCLQSAIKSLLFPPQCQGLNQRLFIAAVHLGISLSVHCQPPPQCLIMLLLRPVVSTASWMRLNRVLFYGVVETNMM